MAHPDLTSHHVNYLIWRYLQESGHGEAAVMLQRAWFHDPQSLPFAPYIKTHALVSLVQKGLQYHDLEQSLDKEGNPVPTTPSNYFFGPAPLDPETLRSHGGGGDAVPASVSPISKVARDGDAINGHSSTDAGPKKPRKGDRAGINGNDMPMEIDSNGFANQETRSQSPADVDGDGDVSMGGRPDSQDQEPAAPPTFTLTTGHSVGVQITPTKAADLSPNTAIVDVASADHVTRTLWRPGDTNMVVAAGDTFCSLWKLSSSSHPVQEKLVEDGGDGACVSTVAWDSTGQKLAVATYNDMKGSITMYNTDGSVVDLLPEVPRMISGLHWAEHNSRLIVVASDSKISELALWDDSLRPDEFPSPQVIDGSIYDLCWSGRNQAYACGDGSVYQYDVDTSVHLTRTFSSSQPDTPWTFIRSVNVGSTSVVVTAASSTGTFWIPTHDMVLEDAHQHDITSIDLRIQKTSESSQQGHQIVLASTSTDDTVRIWHIDLESKRFECVHRLVLGPAVPALAGGFSPDGYAIAAASKDKLFIWNAERGGTAMATWTKPGSEAKTEDGLDHVNGHNGISEPMPYRSLSWDSNGKKLAIGFGKQMAIVNLQR